MDDKKVFQCYECADGVQIFATEEALITHKWDMIRASKRKSHMCCHVCHLDHRTFEGLVRHYQLCHPAKQQLPCPGCHTLFTRLHLLMMHLNDDKCPHILAERVAENRILQVQATNLVAAAAYTAAISEAVHDADVDKHETTNKDGHGGSDGHQQDGLPRPGAASAAAGQGRGDGLGTDGGDGRGDAPIEVGSGLFPEEAGRAAQLGIYDTSGVSLRDFGYYVRIDPATASNVHFEVAAAAAGAVGGAGLGLSVGIGAGSMNPPGRKIAESSDEAMQQLLQRQRQMGVGGVLDENRNGRGPKGKGKGTTRQTAVSAAATADVATGVAVSAFRRGDSKAPDLLTDDANAVPQKFQGLHVWAGQAMLETASGRGSGAPAPRTTGLGTGLSSVLDAVAPAVEAHAERVATTSGATTDGHRTTTTMATRPSGLRLIDHPSHPRFNVYRYKDRINGRFHCPSEMCRRAGRIFKTAGSLVHHLRDETAHGAQEVQCPWCFGYFKSINALTQHCESQSSRCQFREAEDYLPFLNILTAGVAEVQGRNIDMTLAYNVQPTAAQALLQDEPEQSSTAADGW